MNQYRNEKSELEKNANCDFTLSSTWSSFHSVTYMTPAAHLPLAGLQSSCNFHSVSSSFPEILISLRRIYYFEEARADRVLL